MFSRSTFRSVGLVIGAALLAGVGAVVAVPRPAHADVLPEVACTGSETLTYTPGVTLEPTPKTVTTNIEYLSCVSVDPAIRTARIENTVRSRVTCLDPLNNGSDKMTIEWSNGETSEYSYNRTVTNLAGQTVTLRHGTITDGLFDGEGALMINAGPQLNVDDCLKAGIDSRTGSSTLLVGSLPAL